MDDAVCPLGESREVKGKGTGLGAAFRDAAAPHNPAEFSVEVSDGAWGEIFLTEEGGLSPQPRDDGLRSADRNNFGVEGVPDGRESVMLSEAEGSVIGEVCL